MKPKSKPIVTRLRGKSARQGAHAGGYPDDWKVAVKPLPRDVVPKRKTITHNPLAALAKVKTP